MPDSDLIDFILLSDPNVRYVVLGTMLICTSAAVVGCFLFLRKRALVGDAIAHAVLPGICVAFMVFGTKEPWVLLIGATVSGWLSLVFIDTITRWSKLKADSAIGIALTWFFAIGILLLTVIQRGGNASQSGLDKFLFGSAASMLSQDVLMFSWVAFTLLISCLFFFRVFKLIIFDADYAASIGLPIKGYDLLISTLTVVAVATGIQSVGVVLMAALLITPAAAARFWTDDLRRMLILAAVFGLLPGYLGTYVSYTSPRMPTGPWIVLIASMIAILSFFLGARKGLLVRLLQHRANQRKVVRENVLKLLYHLGENDSQFTRARSRDEMMNKRAMSPLEWRRGVQELRRMDLIVNQGSGFALTKQGAKEGERITRLHRLWEMYLNRYMKIAPDHVHDDAEAIEHIITPEIEEELLLLLERPEKDPHQSRIPYTEDE